MNKTYIFIHIPKTAGTTLRYHFQKYLINQETFIHFANKGNKDALKKGLLPYEQRPESERKKAKVILGHNVTLKTKELVGNNHIKEVVFFRDPNEWTISRYNQYANALDFRHKPYLSFYEWLKKETISSQFDWLLINYAQLTDIPQSFQSKLSLLQKISQKIEIVALVKDIDQTMKKINDKLNIPNKMNKENVTGIYRKRNIFALDNKNLEILALENQGENIFFKEFVNTLTDKKVT